MTEDLLVLARAQGGTLPVRRERLPAAELLAGVRARYERRAREAGRPLEIVLDEGVELSVDRLRAEQALGNLVENALRYGDGRIVIEARRAGGVVELHVSDDGPGFGPEFLEHAFEPFSRGDPSRASGGAGLGLTIVQVIALAHDGVARVTNRDVGADAWIEVPDPAAPDAGPPG